MTFNVQSGTRDLISSLVQILGLLLRFCVAQGYRIFPQSLLSTSVGHEVFTSVLFPTPDVTFRNDSWIRYELPRTLSLHFRCQRRHTESLLKSLNTRYRPRLDYHLLLSGHTRLVPSTPRRPVALLDVQHDPSLDTLLPRYVCPRLRCRYSTVHTLHLVGHSLSASTVSTPPSTSRLISSLRSSPSLAHVTPRLSFLR